MPSFDIKSEIDKHELTNVVDQANRVLKNRFDFKDANAEFKLNENTICSCRFMCAICQLG